jgi:Secretion system C-terminal sorting domain
MKSLFFLLFSITALAQNTFVVQGGNLVVSNQVEIVLENTKFENNGTLSATNGTIHLIGNASSSYSSIGGSGTNDFHNLTINKSTNNAMLTNAISVSNQLNISSGNLELGANDLTMGTAGAIVSSPINYIQTSSTGRLGQTVASGSVLFPIGNGAYQPIEMSNDGTTDVFFVRSKNQVLDEGTTGNILSAEIVNCTWYVEENVVGGSDVTMTAKWLAADELTGFDRTNCYISHYTAGSWDVEMGAIATGNSPYSISRSGITSFSPFAVTSSSTPLPLELLSFEGENLENKHLLKWHTANEVDMQRFELQQSKNAIDFNPIGNIAAKNQINNYYQFINSNLFEQINYYRLKIYELDGSFKYSNIVALNHASESTIKLYPNPTNGIVFIDTENRNQLLNIYDSKGALVLSYNEVPNQIDFSDLANGVYGVRIGESGFRLIYEK